MRISSDATIFGAYVAVSEASCILDIGTGTGLLALMLAQRARPTAHIDAIEIDSSAFKAATTNVELSQFASMISVIHTPVQDHVTRARAKYDLIVCNPPFFQSDLVTNKGKSMHLARHAHEDGLDFSALISLTSQLLSPHGRFWVLLPSREAQVFRSLATKSGLAERHRLSLHHKKTSPENRTISAYALESGDLVTANLTRHRDDLEPTDEMRTLLAPYMLHY